jgi:hypothetical protein
MRPRAMVRLRLYLTPLVVFNIRDLKNPAKLNSRYATGRLGLTPLAGLPTLESPYCYGSKTKHALPDH